MTKECLLILLLYWYRNPLQLFAIVSGLAIATALWTGVQAINTEARASYDDASATLNTGNFDQLVPKQGNSISQEVYIKLRRAGWLVSPIIEGQFANVQLLGIDSLTAPPGIGVFSMNEIFDILQNEDPLSLITNKENANTLEQFSKVRIDPSVSPGMAVGDVGLVQELLNRKDLSRLFVLPLQPLGQPKLTDIAPNLYLVSSGQAADLTQLTNSFHLNLTAFGILSFAVGLFIVYSTIGLAFEQRRGIVRTLRSLGLPLRLLINVMIIEMLTLTLIGAFIGIAIGYFIAALLLPDVAATLRGLYGAKISGTLEFRTEWWLSGLLICIIGSGAAFAGRIWQIRQMPLLESAKPRAWAIAREANVKYLGLAAMALLTIALILMIWGNGLILAFALLACVLIGAALALPLLASIILNTLRSRSLSPIWSWFWADTRHQLPGLSLALMALLLAISANIGVSTMVSSFRLTFSNFLDQRLAPELFIEVDSAQESANLEAYLSKKSLEALPLWKTERQISGQPVNLFGIRVSQTYLDNWEFLAAMPEAWNRVEAGISAIINEQLARRTDLWVGDFIDISPEVRLPIVAIVGDYGNPKGQVIVAENIIKHLQPGIYAKQFGVRSNNVAQLRNKIIMDVGIPSKNMIDQAAIKSMSMEIFDRTFKITQALNVLTLGVSGFALLMSLLTLADQRIPQLAPLWAIGLTARQLSQLELLRAMALSILIFLFALPLGLVLAWILLSIVNVEAFGWRLPMYLFPRDYFLLGAYGFVATLLASLWPAVKLMRVHPSFLLKVFTNER